MIKSRTGADTHARIGVSEMIESMVFTPEKVEKIGLDPDTVPQGWWVGFHVTDDQVWEQIRHGRKRGFSIGGAAVRVPVEKATVQVRQYTRGKQKVRAHTRGGGAEGKGGISAPWGMAAFPGAVQLAIQRTVDKRMREEGVDLRPETLQGNLLRLFDASFRSDRRGHERSMAWYKDASAFGQSMADIHGTSRATAVGIIAALSPQTAWGINKEMSHSLMALLSANPVIGNRRLSEHSPDELGRMMTFMAHPGARVTEGARAGEQANVFIQSSGNISKAVRLWRGESADSVLGNGPKVRSFYNNLLLPDQGTSWTDDTHMRRIWLNDPLISNQSNRFRRIFGIAPTLSSEGYNRTWGSYPYYADQGGTVAAKLGVLPHEVQAVTWTQWRKAHGDTRDSDAVRSLLTSSDLVRSLQDVAAMDQGPL